MSHPALGPDVAAALHELGQLSPTALADDLFKTAADALEARLSGEHAPLMIV